MGTFGRNITFDDLVIFTGTGNSQCTPCEIGKSQNDVGSTSCEPCLASKGEYTNKEGSVECQIVELGFKVVSEGKGLS